MVDGSFSSSVMMPIYDFFYRIMEKVLCVGLLVVSHILNISPRFCDSNYQIKLLLKLTKTNESYQDYAAILYLPVRYNDYKNMFQRYRGFIVFHCGDLYHQ